MSLRNKVSLIVSVVFILSALLSFGIQRWSILPSFVKLEEEVAVQNMARVIEAIDRELDQISPSVSDWSVWTDTYEFAKGQNPGYIEANLDVGATLAGMHMNYLGIFDASGAAVWTQAYDIEEEEVLDLGALTGDHLGISHPLFQQPELTGAVKGLIKTPHGPLLICAKKILTNDGQGPPAGILIMGRFLNANFISRLAELTRLSVSISPASLEAPSDWIDKAKGGVAYTRIGLTEGAGHWMTRSTLADLNGDPILSAQVDTPRDISARGAAAVNASLWSLGATGLIMMAVLWLLLQRTILRPIHALTEHALKIGADDDLSAHLDLDRQDEFGVLAGTFDTMVGRLSKARRRLIDQSYHSGVAEMASGVLHNIGNTLTPLTVQLSNLQQELGAAPVSEVKQASAELASSTTPMHRREDLTMFMELAGLQLAELVDNSRDGIANAAQQVVYLQTILADQERFSRSERVVEPVDMAEVLQEAAAGLSPDLAAAVQLDITPSVTETGEVLGARTALQQVATNLLLNAAESIHSGNSGRGKITVSSAIEETQNQMMAHIQIEDNGAGIHPGDLERVFEQGFSTKNREGSGHGLHWCANTLQALNGRIVAESDGVGCGASLHLWLPLAQVAALQATGTEG